jgi:predicted amidohydrolase YtcJ
MTARPTNLREAHAHLHWHGRSLSMLNLDDCTGVGECIELLAHAASRLAPGEWLLASGARVESWPERRWPTLGEIDAVTGQRPAVVMSFDHHALLANTPALDRSRVVGNGPAAGVVCRAEDGPTGLLLEAAAYQAWNAAPEPTPAQWRILITAAVEHLAVHGFTEVHDLYAPAWLGPMLAELDRAGRLPIDVRLYAPIDVIEEEIGRSRAYTTGRVGLAGAKVFADGTLNSRTAWMLHPFADPLPDLPRGKLVTPPSQLRAAVERTARLTMGLAVHAIGDAAVRAVLDAAETAASEGTDVSRVRIEHCELIDEADVPRFATLGVTASVQPCHLLADIEALRRNVPHRLDRVLPLRELIDSGLIPGKTLIFGSDTPVVRPDPEDSIQAAVHRRRPGADLPQAIAPSQAITEAEAWQAFSRS